MNRIIMLYSNVSLNYLWSADKTCCARNLTSRSITRIDAFQEPHEKPNPASKHHLLPFRLTKDSIYELHLLRITDNAHIEKVPWYKCYSPLRRIQQTLIMCRICLQKWQMLLQNVQSFYWWAEDPQTRPVQTCETMESYKLEKSHFEIFKC